MPQVHRYNTQSRPLQGQYLMSNHVATINNPTYTPINPSPLVLPAVEDWAVIDQATGNLTLQPGMSNAVIWPKKGRAQEYRHLIKGPDKLK